MKNMVALIGEQPVPNLLPILHDEPEAVLLVRTARTTGVSERIKKVLEQLTRIEFVDVTDPYDPSDVYRIIEDQLQKLDWRPKKTVFNVTGGTKTMAFAAYQLALDQHSEFLYLESERRRSQLRQYTFEMGKPLLIRDETLPMLITLEQYLHVHLSDFQERGFSKNKHDGQLTPGGLFERCLYQTLEPEIDEIKAGIYPDGMNDQLEIDLIVRRGNQVGIIEAKTGAQKKAIDQLTNAGGREYLGTYTAKFWVTGRILSRELKTLAAARNIKVVELPKYRQGQALPRHEREHLIRAIHEELG